MQDSVVNQLLAKVRRFLISLNKIQKHVFPKAHQFMCPIESLRPDKRF